MSCAVCSLDEDGQAVSAEAEGKILDAFESDVRNGSLPVIALEDRHALAASELLARLRQHPLRTLDALHLAIAMENHVRVLATGDRVIARDAATLRLSVALFG